MLLPHAAAPRRESPAAADFRHHRLSPPGPAAIKNKDEGAETSIQAAIVKLTGENSGSVGCGGAFVSNKEETEVETDNTSTEERAAGTRRRGGKANKRGRETRKFGNTRNLQEGDGVNFALDASPTRDGAGGNRRGSAGGGSGGGSKRQRLLAGGQKTSSRQKLPNRGFNTVLINGEVALGQQNNTKKERMKMENGSASGGTEPQQLVDNEDRDEQPGLGWASRIWGAVQRFARRV
jgi:hypothetical protein